MHNNHLELVTAQNFEWKNKFLTSRHFTNYILLNLEHLEISKIGLGENIFFFTCEGFAVPKFFHPAGSPLTPYEFTRVPYPAQVHRLGNTTNWISLLGLKNPNGTVRVKNSSQSKMASVWRIQDGSHQIRWFWRERSSSNHQSVW